MDSQSFPSAAPRSSSPSPDTFDAMVSTARAQLAIIEQQMVQSNDAMVDELISVKQAFAELAKEKQITIDRLTIERDQALKEKEEAQKEVEVLKKEVEQVKNEKEFVEGTNAEACKVLDDLSRSLSEGLSKLGLSKLLEKRGAGCDSDKEE